MEENKIQIESGGKWFKANRVNIFDNIVTFTDVDNPDIQVALPVEKIRRMEFSPDMEVGYQKTAFGLKLFSIAPKRQVIVPDVEV